MIRRLRQWREKKRQAREITRRCADLLEQAARLALRLNFPVAKEDLLPLCLQIAVASLHTTVMVRQHWEQAGPAPEGAGITRH